MLINKRLPQFASLVVTCAFAFSSLLASANIQPSNDGEGMDREVDEAALTSQQDATSELMEMIRTYKDTPREADFLEKLAEVQQQSAAMEFRIVHGKVGRDGKPVNLSKYRAAMATSIPTLTRLIEKYPNNESTAHFYFMRGIAFQETLSLDAAKKDYLHLTNNFPSAPEAMPAFMSLGEFAMDKNNFGEAINDFNQIARHTDDSHYPHALYKTAWSQYRMNQVEQALATSEKLVKYLRAKDPKTSSTSEQGMLENILRDVPLFYYSGNLPIEKALPFFKSLDHDQSYGHMLIEYGNLLRTHDREKDLFAWKDIVLAQEPNRAESYEILLTTFDYQMNRMNYADLSKSVGDIVKTYAKYSDSDDGKRAQKLMLDASVAVQKLMLQQPEKKDEYARYLTVIYSGFTKMAGENDPRLRSIHMNLAETYFSIKDYELAVQNYRWVVAHGSFSNKDGGVSGSDAALKSIAARYETLKEQKLVPGEAKADLTAVARPKKDPSKTPAALAEWISWIDAYVSHAGPIDNFEFEASRCLYAQGEINQSMDRMRGFALRRSTSPVAIPTATLVVDTEIASGNWERLYNQLNEFLHVASWKNTDFDKRIYTLAADTKLKMAQTFASNGNNAAALNQADEFVKSYPANEHLVDALTLAGKSAIAEKNRSRAAGYFAAIASATPNTETAAKALLSKAKLEEERYSFADAVKTYVSYLNLPSQATSITETRKTEIKRRVLSFAWLSGDASLLNQTLENKKLCTRELRSDCERYAALRVFAMSSNQSIAREAIRSEEHASPQTKAIWAAIALKNPALLSQGLRHKMLHVLVGHWKQTEELARFTILPTISNSVPEIFTLDRKEITQSGALRADSKSLTKRLKEIAEVEKFAGEASELPWSRIRALVLNDMSSIYMDLAAGVRALPYPAHLRTPRDRDAYRRMIEQLVSPFDQKSYAIRSEAYRLASQTSVEPEVYNEIARAYYQDVATSMASKKSGIPHQRRDASIDLALVRSIDEDGSWKSVNLDSANASDLLRSRWAQALRAKDWPQVGYFAQEAKQKSLLKPEVTEVANAVSLAQAGAKAEGAMELQDICRSVHGSRLNSTCSGLKESL